MSAEKPALEDPRWRHHADHPTERVGMVHQEWSLIDEDGNDFRHIEWFVNWRARTERPPV